MENTKLYLTKELYNLIQHKRDKLSVDEVTPFIEKGVILEHVLYLCITYWCPPKILEYLLKCGADDTKHGTFYTVFYHSPKEFVIDIDNIVIYATVKNAILDTYHRCVGSHALDIQIAVAYGNYKNDPWIRNISKKEPRVVVSPFLEQIENIKEYCKIFNFDFNSLINEELELPEDLEDDSIVPEWGPDCI